MKLLASVVAALPTSFERLAALRSFQSTRLFQGLFRSLPVVVFVFGRWLFWHSLGLSYAPPAAGGSHFTEGYFVVAYHAVTGRIWTLVGHLSLFRVLGRPGFLLSN